MGPTLSPGDTHLKKEALDRKLQRAAETLEAINAMSDHIATLLNETERPQAYKTMLVNIRTNLQTMKHMIEMSIDNIVWTVKEAK